MKTCVNARNCEWGHKILPNKCGYKEVMCEYDLCPKAIFNYESIIDQMAKSSKFNQILNDILSMKEGAEYVE